MLDLIRFRLSSQLQQSGNRQRNIAMHCGVWMIGVQEPGSCGEEAEG